MTIAEIIERLSQERSFGSRFPVRIIFVENLDEYLALENQLRGTCDVTMNVADFCRAKDTVPQFEQIKKRLKECEGKQILLPAIKSVIHKVDIENKKMTVSLMEGLEK